MNQSEILKHATEVATYNKYTGKVLAFADGNVFFERTVADVNAAVEHSKQTGATIYRINIDTQAIGTIAINTLIKEYTTKAVADANPEADNTAASLKHEELPEGIVEVDGSKDLEEEDAIRAIQSSESITDLQEFVAGDDREAVQKAAEARIAELNAPPVELSKDMTAKEAIARIGQLEANVEVINAFVVGDERQTVIKAAADRVHEITNA